MAERKIIYKKEALQNYVSGKLDHPSQLIEASSISKYCSKKRIQLIPNPLLLLFATGLLSIGILLIGISNRELNLQNYAGILGAVCIGLGLINAEFLFSGYFRSLRKFRDSLREPLEEVLYLKEYLVTYLRDLDKRTSRYFSLITDNKASNYLMINNIKIVLQEKINEIEECLGLSGSTSLKTIDKVLRGNIEVCDGIDPYSGNMHSIPLTKLAETVDFLISNMEKSIRVLEDDLKNPQNPAEL